MKRTAELKAKIANRDTEIQRWYDLALEVQSEKIRKRQELQVALSILESEIDAHNTYLSGIMSRAADMGCLDILF